MGEGRPRQSTPVARTAAPFFNGSDWGVTEKGIERAA